MIANRFKQFYTNYAIYIIPAFCSFFYFYKIGDISFWFDELATLKNIHKTNFTQFLLSYSDNQLHPPLYFFLLKIFYCFVDFAATSSKIMWLSIFNIYNSLQPIWSKAGFSLENFQNIYASWHSYNFLNQLNQVNELSIRFISALSMSALIFLCFRFFVKQSLLLFGIVVSLFFGLNFQLIYYAQEARPYGLLCLLSALVFIEFYKVYNKELNLKNLKKLLILNLLMAATHYYAIFLILGQLLILSIKNSKRINFIILFAISFLVSTLFFLYFYDTFLINSKIQTLNDFNLTSFRSITKAFISERISIRPLFFLAIAIIIKSKYKTKSNLDSILLKIFIFTGSVLLILYIFCLFRPAFNVRYIIPLAPLVGILYCGIFYSFSEAIFIFIKDIKLKKIGTAGVFIIFSLQIVNSQYYMTFGTRKYYGAQKNYYIENAYLQIVQDKDYKKNANYILEEYMPHYFNYYSKKYDLSLVESIDPDLDIETKKNNLKLIAKNLNGQPTVYYIQVRHNELKSSTVTPVELSGYNRILLFSRDNIKAYKFTLI